MRSLLLLFALALSACGEGGEKKYLKIYSGGISFDQDHRMATMAVAVKALRPLPEDGQLVARFETSGATDKAAQNAQFGQLIYKFESRAQATVVKDNSFRVQLTVLDASGGEVERLEQDFGGMIDKHDVPVHSDMVPDRERQVRQYNDEGF